MQVACCAAALGQRNSSNPLPQTVRLFLAVTAYDHLTAQMVRSAQLQSSAARSTNA